MANKIASYDSRVKGIVEAIEALIDAKIAIASPNYAIPKPTQFQLTELEVLRKDVTQELTSLL